MILSFKDRLWVLKNTETVNLIQIFNENSYFHKNVNQSYTSIFKISCKW